MRKSKKKVEQNRTRYRTIAFRCSDKERSELEKRIELSGLQKQDYFLKSVLHQRVVVVGNAILFESLRDNLHEIKAELERLGCPSDLNPDTLMPLRTAIEMLEGFENV